MSLSSYWYYLNQARPRTDPKFTVPNQVIVFFSILHGVLHKRSDVSEDHNAFIFRETELVQADDEMIQKKKSTIYVGQFEGVRPITAAEGRQMGQDGLEPVGVKISKDGDFLGVSPVGYVEVMWLEIVVSSVLAFKLHWA